MPYPWQHPEQCEPPCTECQEIVEQTQLMAAAKLGSMQPETIRSVAYAMDASSYTMA